MSEHTLVDFSPDGAGGFIVQTVKPTPGLVARCPGCGTVIKGADPDGIVGCPQTEQFAALVGVLPA